MKKILFLLQTLLLLHTQIFIAKEINGIKADYEEVNPGDNPVELLIDYLNKHVHDRGHCFWIWSPDRDVPLLRIGREDGKLIRNEKGEIQDYIPGELTYLHFSIPHRIDMHSKYSEQIDTDVDTRKELPFTAFGTIRNVPLDETVDITLDSNWTLYNARLVDAGRHGHLICYNSDCNHSGKTDKPDTRNVSCMTLKEFGINLAYYKPNKDRYKDQ